jgi:hypothetical protein
MRNTASHSDPGKKLTKRIGRGDIRNTTRNVLIKYV